MHQPLFSCLPTDVRLTLLALCTPQIAVPTMTFPRSGAEVSAIHNCWAKRNVGPFPTLLLLLLPLVFSAPLLLAPQCETNIQRLHFAERSRNVLCTGVHTHTCVELKRPFPTFHRIDRASGVQREQRASLCVYSNLVSVFISLSPLWPRVAHTRRQSAYHVP